MIHHNDVLPDYQLSARHADWGYPGHPVISDLSLKLPTGKITAIVGPNGCGKSTLLMGLAHLIKPTSGDVSLNERSISSYSPKELARMIALLGQTSTAPDGITVADLVARGRYPYHSALRKWTVEDEAAVIDALTTTSTIDLAQRRVDRLSGGQRQRVWIAMALAQQTPILLLDEPTTFLDLSHQVDILDLFVELNRRDRLTIVLILHDLNHAARHADHLVAMKNGAIVASGPPVNIITADLIREVFDTESRIIIDEVSQTPVVIPASRHERHLEYTPAEESGVRNPS